MHNDSTSTVWGTLDQDGNIFTNEAPRSRRPAPLKPYGVMQEQLRRYEELKPLRKELEALRRKIRNSLLADLEDVEPGALSAELKAVSYRNLTHAALRYSEGDVEAERIINSIPTTPGYRLSVWTNVEVLTQPPAPLPTLHTHRTTFGMIPGDTGESDGQPETYTCPE